MTPQDAFFTVHRDLPREGPGSPGDVAWALEHLGISGAVRVLDAACGPGADLETLAELLPEARIEGIDKVAHFAGSAAARVARFGPRVSAAQGDMSRIEGPYDLIWCAGAIYFLGIAEGLALWRGALASDGAVAFSEPILLSGDEPEAVGEFWADYPAITELAGIEARVKAAGFRMLDHRLIIGPGWQAYYTPMRARIAALGEGADDLLTAALDESAHEIALWEAAPDRIAYALILARPE